MLELESARLDGGMYSEMECGVCYRTFNAGHRCPRELRCLHTFCESCLRALARGPAGPGDTLSIVCPLCREPTSISGQRHIRAELRVDERVLGRLLEAGVLHRDEDAEEEDAETQLDREEGDTPPETPAEGRGSSSGSRGGRLRGSWKKVWRIIIGRSHRHTGDEACFVSSDDLRNLAMMSSYMF